MSHPAVVKLRLKIPVSEFLPKYVGVGTVVRILHPAAYIMTTMHRVLTKLLHLQVLHVKSSQIRYSSPGKPGVCRFWPCKALENRDVCIIFSGICVGILLCRILS